MSERARPSRLVDVAERAGVSIATASRSLTGTSGVSPALAERVRAVAASMGYVPNAHARSLAGGQEASVGLVVGAIDDPYFAEIASGVIDAATEAGQLVQLSHAGGPSELLAQVRSLRAYNVGAILLAGSGLDGTGLEDEVAEELAAFRSSGGRVAVIGRHSFTADAVLPPSRDGGRAVGEHLLALGHTRVAVVAGPAELTTVVDRLGGLLDVLGTAAVSVTHHAFGRAGGADGARRALDEHPEVTAIAALSDVLAIGVLAELRARGIRVPDQLSVTGFDDISVAADLAPALTTVRLDLARIGAEALGLTARAPGGEAQSVSTGYELVVRDSTAAR